MKTPSCVTSLVTTKMTLSALLLIQLPLQHLLIDPTLLNLVMKEQFSVAAEDAALHLNNFVELYDMQKYKEVDGDIVNLKLFPFSLRVRAKEWLQSLPKNNIDSWDK